VFRARAVTTTTYLARRPSPLARLRAARASDAWRAAADLVWICWQAVLEGGPEARSGTFAAYLAALDAEEAAADSLALPHPSRAV
jgi:hypothetical protein